MALSLALPLLGALQLSDAGVRAELRDALGAARSEAERRAVEMRASTSRLIGKPTPAPIASLHFRTLVPGSAASHHLFKQSTPSSACNYCVSPSDTPLGQPNAPTRCPTYSMHPRVLRS
mmetsp:Transcript_36928/g.90002  ORF Transcript_36928/g.90002 Transcript_36928/m.90002 type:complete len:119 (-) Transcript_36928:284-640(-)